MFEKLIIKKIKKYIKKKINKYYKNGLIKVPKFKKMSVGNLRTGDIILFTGGNKLTEFHGKYCRPELGHLDKPPYHAALFYEHSETDHIIVDPELMTSFSSIYEYLKRKPKITINVIRYKLDQKEIEHLRTFMAVAAREELIYDGRGYVSFASDLPYLGWLSKIKALRPSKKNFFCSDLCASAYEDIRAIGEREPNKTSPKDIMLFALKLLEGKHPMLEFIKTLQQGT